MESEPETLRDLMESKLRNAKQRFAEPAKKAGLDDRLKELTLDELLAGLLANSLVWSLLESCETEFLLSLAEGATNEENAEEVEAFVSAVRSLTPEELTLAWRYVNFFIKCLKE